jgi:hypothetical protein
VDQGDDGAFSFNTLNDKTRSLDKDDWKAYRFGMVCGKPDAFAELKKEIEQFCNSTNKCTYEQQQKIQAIMLKMRGRWNFKPDYSTSFSPLETEYLVRP